VRVGDSVEAATRKVGQTPRRGTVTAVRGALITVRWESGDETNVIPAAGSLTVVGAARSAGTKKSSPKPAAGRTPAAKATSKKAAAKKPAAKKPAAKKPASKRAANGR
jgi:DNA topoisomerase I